MSQHDGVIDDSDGLTVLNDMNDLFAAILTNSSGATEPSTTYAFQWWADTNTSIIKQRNSTNTAWISRFAFNSSAIPTDLTIVGDLTLSGATGTISRDVTDDGLILYGGTDGDGANVTLFGSTHGSLPDTLVVNADYMLFRDQAEAGTNKVEMFLGASGPTLDVTRSAAVVAAFNRTTDDGIIVAFQQDGVTEGSISIAGNTTSYNPFCGSHYTQLKEGQAEFPIGAVVVSTGEIIPCSVEKETEVDMPFKDAIKTVAKVSATETKRIEVEDKDEEISYAESQESYKDENEKIKKKLKGNCFLKNKKYHRRKEPTVLETENIYDEIQGKEITKSKMVFAKKMINIKRLKKGVYYNGDTKTFYKAKSGYRIDVETQKVYEPKRIQVPNKEYFTYVETTKIAGDKAVYGTYQGKVADDAKGMSFGEDDKPVYNIAQVGLFKCRVTNTNGNIDNGDWLETSTRPNEGQRQTAKTRYNSTVGKAMTDVDWSTVEVDTELGYKWKLIPIIF